MLSVLIPAELHSAVATWIESQTELPRLPNTTEDPLAEVAEKLADLVAVKHSDAVPFQGCIVDRTKITRGAKRP